MGALMTGCGNADTDTAETTQESMAESETGTEAGTEDYGPEAYLSGINVADYVTLGEYKGIEVSVDAPVVTDEYLDSYIDYVLQSNMLTTQVTNRPVQEGDIVNIDYEGKIDGVAFDGGTAQGYDLAIGSGSFIDGFEDGLIGAETGETRDVAVTFPEDYHGTDVAGKDAVFTVTVNSISVETLPELTDEFVQGLGVGAETVEEYRQYAYDLLMEEQQANHDTEAEVAVLETVMNNAKLQDPPEDMTDRYYGRLIDNMNYYASMYGYDLETFLSLNGTSEEAVRESAGDAAKQLITMQAVAEADCSARVVGMDEDDVAAPLDAQRVVLPDLYHAQADGTHAHQRHGNQGQRGIALRADEEQRQHRHQGPGGVADRGGDGQLDVPEAHVAHGHGEDVQQGYRQVGPQDGQGDLRAAHKDLIGRVKPHNHAHGHDHLQMAVLVPGIPAADLGKQVRAAPAEQRDNRKPKPHRFFSPCFSL